MITEPQRRIWIALDAAQRAQQLPPTLRELQVQLGYKTPSAVSYQLQGLIRSGIASVDKQVARSVTLLEPYNWFDG